MLKGSLQLSAIVQGTRREADLAIPEVPDGPDAVAGIVSTITGTLGQLGQRLLKAEEEK